jgi:hypothetical protein
MSKSLAEAFNEEDARNEREAIRESRKEWRGTATAERHLDTGLFVVTQNVTPLNKKATILDTAAMITAGDRQRDYDSPMPNHARIAKLWNSYLSIRKKGFSSDITPEDVATMMILLKIARQVFTPKTDNLVDICGYARCLEQIGEERGQENANADQGETT